jgi:hypothetical protein
VNPVDDDGAVLTRALAAAQSQSIEAARSAERARQWNLFLGIGMIGFAGASFFLLFSSALRNGNNTSAAELGPVVAALRDAVSERKEYESKLRSLEKQIQQLQLQTAGGNNSSGGNAISGSNNSTGASDPGAGLELIATDPESELQSTKIELAAARAKIDEQAKRAAADQEGLEKLIESFQHKRNNTDGPTSRPAGAPAEVSDRTVREINSLIAYSTKTNMHLVSATLGAPGELRGVLFGKGDERGRSQGFVGAERAVFEELQVEPRLRLKLLDGYDLYMGTRVGFSTRVIEFRAVDPAEWRRRLSEVWGAAESRPAGEHQQNNAAQNPQAQQNTATQQNTETQRSGETQRSASPQLRESIERINRLFAAHKDYVHLRVEDVSMAEGDSWFGVTVSQLVTDRGQTIPRVDQIVRARRMSLSHQAQQQRLEIELEDGTRGPAAKQVPIPGGRMRLLLPGVSASELTGDPPLPIRKS